MILRENRLLADDSQEISCHKFAISKAAKFEMALNCLKPYAANFHVHYSCGFGAQ